MALQALVVRVPPFLVPAVQLHMVDLFLGLSTAGCQVPSFCSYWIRVQLKLFTNDVKGGGMGAHGGFGGSGGPQQSLQGPLAYLERTTSNIV